MNDKLPVRRLHPEAVLPTRAHQDDAGLDLYALEDAVLSDGEGRIVKTGVAIALPAGHVGLISDRSSMAKRGLKTAGGVIDAGYRGELGVVLLNLSGKMQTVAKGERIAQLLILPVAAPAVQEVAALDPTARGDKGFGSTGR